MRYITTNYVNNEFSSSDEPIDILDEFKNYIPTYIDKQHIFKENLIGHFTEKYKELIFSIYRVDIKNPVLGQYVEYLQKNKKNILKYNNISNSFFIDYALVFDNSDIIDKSKNILMFNTGVNISEALLFYKTSNNQFLSGTYYVENILHINGGDISLYKKYFDILKNNFSGEDIQVNMNYQNSIESMTKYQNKNIDLIILDYRRYKEQSGTFYDNPQMELTFQIIATILSSLNINGSFIFHNDPYSPSYLKIILHLLAKYFKSIRVYKTKIRDRDYFVCHDFVGYQSIDKNDIQLLLTLKNMKYTVSNEISDFVEDYFQYYEHNINKKIKTYNKYLELLNGITLNNLIKYYHNAIEVEYSEVLLLCKKYKLALTDDFVYKHTKIPNPVHKLSIYQPIKYYGICADLAILKKNSSNDAEYKLALTTNACKLDILNEITKDIIINKIGIDTRSAQKWDEITRRANISDYLIKKIKYDNDVVVTRAFTKLHEMLHTFDIINGKQSTCDSLHICEAPGNFINSTVHFIKSRFPNIKHTWYGNSLNPFNKENIRKYGKVPSDMYGFIKQYPDRWLWGDGTGDITQTPNLQFFREKYYGKFDFVTSDCGLETTKRIEYFTQELKMSHANFCQILIALITLKIGGSAILKFFFPFNEPLSVSVIYLLVLSFKFTYIVKPVTSSATNNEIYFVCVDKEKHLSQSNLDFLFRFNDDFSYKKFLFTEIDESFMDQLEIITRKFADYQIEQLNIIYQLYDIKIDSVATQIQHSQKIFAKYWTQLNDFNYVNPDNFLHK